MSKFQELYEAIIAEAYVAPNQVVVYKTKFGGDYDVAKPPEEFFAKWPTSNTKKKQQMLKDMDKGFGVSAIYVDKDKNEKILLSYKP